MTKALVLLNGGMDSTIALAGAIFTVGVSNVYALTIYYSSHKEVRAAEKVARVYGCEHEVLALPGLFNNTNSDDVFVEGRNLMFLSIAANRAASWGANLIIVGTSKAGISGHPDCCAGFFMYMEHAIKTGLGMDRMLVNAPMLPFSKAEVVQSATRMAEAGSKVMEALAWSHTCTRDRFCGDCHACSTRANAFKEVGIVDPLVERVSVLEGEGPCTKNK